MAKAIVIGQPVNDSGREADAIGKEREARALVERWIEAQGTARWPR